LWDKEIAIILSEDVEIDPITLSINKSNFEVSGHAEEISKIIQTGQISTYIEWYDVGLIELLYCIKRGGNGDIDGYGVEPDIWIVDYLDFYGNFIFLFLLSDSELNVNIENILNKWINPIESNA